MNSPQPDASQAKSRSRRWGMIVLGVLLVVGGLGYFVYWLVDARYFESTDDAYVSGDVVQITSEVAGTVIGLHVDDTQRVSAGQPLLELDPADAKIAEANAEADLARAVRNVRGLFAQGRQLRAQIDVRQQALRTADADLARRASLSDDGAISAEELSHARDNVISSRAAVAAALDQLSQTVAQVDGTTIADHPQVLAAAAAVRNAALALHRARLVAPVGGVVAKRSVQVGQRVAAGAPLLAVVPLDDVWVDANFKEVQLARMRTGQPVIVHTDIYGDDIAFHGRVAGLAAGSGNAFALLPAQNASGNWIKIVQRVPVRILLDPHELESHPLRVGLSAAVRVDLHDTSGPAMATAVRNTPQPSQPSAGDDPSIDARIAAIIAENAGPGLHEPAKLSAIAAAGTSPLASESLAVSRSTHAASVSVSSGAVRAKARAATALASSTAQP